MGNLNIDRALADVRRGVQPSSPEIITCKVMTNCLQINVGVGNAAHDLMLATVSQKEVDILLVSEQNRDSREEDGWFPDLAGGGDWKPDHRLDR